MTASGSRLFASVVEHWIIDPATWVRFPLKSWEFFNLICYALSFVTAFCRKMGARPGLDSNGFSLSRNGFQFIINDDFLEEGECNSTLRIAYRFISNL